MATAARIKAQATPPRKTSAAIGRSGKWNFFRRTRPFASNSTTAMQATTPTAQLQAAPIEPSGPPPMSRNVLSIGATV